LVVGGVRHHPHHPHHHQPWPSPIWLAPTATTAVRDRDSGGRSRRTPRLRGC